MAPSVATNISSHLDFKLVKAALNVGDLKRAHKLFDNIPQPDPITRSTLISAYTTHGLLNEAIKLYTSLRARGSKLDKYVFLAVIQASGASGDFMRVKEVQVDPIRCGMMSNVFLGSALVHAYSKCKCVKVARRVFDDLVEKNVVCWTSLCSCYVNCGLPRQALAVCQEMCFNGVKPNSVTVSSILPACSELKDLNSGRAIHGFAVRHGMTENVFVCNALVSMYARCLRLKQARVVFDWISYRDVVSWNAVLIAYFTNKEYEKGLTMFSQMSREGVKAVEWTWNIVISGCLENGQTTKAFEMLRKMQNMGIKPSQITISSILSACTILETLRMGKEVHYYVFRHWLIGDLTSTNALVHMYAKCGDLNLSRSVFDMMPIKNDVTWTIMIVANALHGNGKEVLLLFDNMLKLGVKPDALLMVFCLVVATKG